MQDRKLNRYTKHFQWVNRTKVINVEVTVEKVLIYCYKMHYFLIQSWHGFLGDRHGKLINLKFICWCSFVEKTDGVGGKRMN